MLKKKLNNNKNNNNNNDKVNQQQALDTLKLGDVGSGLPLYRISPPPY